MIDEVVEWPWVYLKQFSSMTKETCLSHRIDALNNALKQFTMPDRHHIGNFGGVLLHMYIDVLVN